MYFTTFILYFLLAPVAATACRDECIASVTNAFLAHYTSTVLTTLQTMANQINTQLIPSSARQPNPIVYFKPVLEAYNRTAYAGLETAILTSYFHNKCRDTDDMSVSECTSSNCPSMCRTTRSMARIHTHPTLVDIAFGQTAALLSSLTTPGSATYNQVLQAVVADASEGHRKRIEKLGRIMPLRNRGTIVAKSTPHNLNKIMKKLPSIMLHTCGGPGLSLCRWEQPVDEFVLQYS